MLTINSPRNMQGKVIKINSMSERVTLYISHHHVFIHMAALVVITNSLIRLNVFTNESIVTSGNPAFLADDADVSEDIEATETSSEATDEFSDCRGKKEWKERSGVKATCIMCRVASILDVQRPKS